VRERRLLLVMTALLALVLIWFALVRPLLDARDAAEQRLNAAVTELARARAEAAVLKQQAASASASALPGPLDAFLVQSGGEQGFTGCRWWPTVPGARRSAWRRCGPRPFSGGSASWRRAG
jgi:type II secretory pathway component PulM